MPRSWALSCQDGVMAKEKEEKGMKVRQEVDSALEVDRVRRLVRAGLAKKAAERRQAS